MALNIQPMASRWMTWPASGMVCSPRQVAVHLTVRMSRSSWFRSARGVQTGEAVPQFAGGPSRPHLYRRRRFHRRAGARRRGGTQVLARMEPYRKCRCGRSHQALQAELRRGVFAAARTDVAVERLAPAMPGLAHDLRVAGSSAASSASMGLGAESAA